MRLERTQRLCRIEMHVEIELAGQARTEIVAPALGFGAIDHADGALQPFVGQRRSGIAFADIEPEAPVRTAMQQCLVAARHPGSHTLALARLVPVGCRGYRAAVRG